MRRFFCPLTLLLVASIFLVSCLNSDETEYVTYDDVAITAFSLSSLNVTHYTTSSTGEDSAYVETVTSFSDYKFIINQTTGEVYNADSLPYRSDPSKILCSVSTKNNGVAIIRSLEKPDSVSYVSSTDTIDFSEPRTITVYSSSGKFSRDYTVKVNIHQQDPDSMQWHLVTTSAEVASLEKIRGFFLNGRPIVLGVKDGQTILCGASIDDNYQTWRNMASLGEGANENAIVRNDSLFVLDQSGLKASCDGISFETIATSVPINRLIAQSQKGLYGIDNDGRMMVSDDGGKSWKADEMEEGTVIPSNNLASSTVTFKSLKNADCVVLVGNRDYDKYKEDTTAIVTTKIVEYTNDALTYPWSMVAVDKNNSYLLPRMDNINLFAYGEAIYAIGGKGIGSSTTEALSAFYESKDQGFTWKKSSKIMFPQQFTSSTSNFTAFVDADNTIWFVCGTSGEIWQGWINNLRSK